MQNIEIVERPQYSCLFYLSKLNKRFSFWNYAHLSRSIMTIRQMPCVQWESKGKVADSMFVTAVLQLVYILKFYWWEGGYLNTLNMMHDRGKRFFCGDLFNGKKWVMN